jgi:hypothetical protein
MGLCRWYFDPIREPWWICDFDRCQKCCSVAIVQIGWMGVSRTRSWSSYSIVARHAISNSSLSYAQSHSHHFHIYPTRWLVNQESCWG